MGGEELYILKHKDLDTAMVKINPFSGRIEYILEVYLPEELPVGCKKTEQDLQNGGICVQYLTQEKGFSRR